MPFRPCIIVPVYNHRSGAAALAAALEHHKLPAIYVNDGSDRACAEALHGLAKEFPFIQVIDHPRNLGKGAAVQTALKTARDGGYSHALQIDADGQHDTNDIPKFLALAAERPNGVVSGQPIFDHTVPKVRLISRYLTHIWVWIETWSLAIRDSMCGFRVYPVRETAALLERTQIGARMDFDIEILVRLYWEGLPIYSIPTKVSYPEDGTSHFSLFRDNWLITKMHVRLVLGMLWRSPALLFRKFKSRGTANNLDPNATGQ